MRVLIIEDDPAQGDALRKTLKAEGFAVEWVVTFAGAEEIIRLYKFDCILLDIALPDGNGEAILRSVKNRSDRTPIIVLAGCCDSPKERGRIINLGAVDCLPKPADQFEVIARVSNAIRNASVSPLPKIALRNLVLDRAQRLIQRDNNPVHLSKREWSILEVLLNRQGFSVSKNTIDQALYEAGAEICSNTIEVYISRIRRKIGRDLIKTEIGFGYMLIAE